MNDERTHPPAMGAAAPGPPTTGAWSPGRWLALIALVFAAHVAAIVVFGGKKPFAPRAVIDAPQLALANKASDLTALNDPTWFALPHAGDFAGAGWPQPVAVRQPSFRWTEPPRWLPLSAENLGALFRQFMQTNRFAEFRLDFKPQPELSRPVLTIRPALPEASTFKITGDLTRRRLLGVVALPSLPANNVIAPSRVQVVVDAAGSVVSAVLLPPETLTEAANRADVGDTNALQIARGLRFAPADHTTLGELIFHWHTVPSPEMNTNAAVNWP